MRYSTTRFLLIIGFAFLLSFATSKAVSQVRQAPQKSQKSLSDKDLQEIDEMRDMVRERKAHQEEQKQILRDLENAIASFSKETGKSSSVSKATSTNTPSTSVSSTLPANYYDAGRPGFVTSESVLSRLDAMEQLRAAKTQYEIDIKDAQREIDLLKKQLAIANDQIDRYKRKMIQMEDEPESMPVYEQRTLTQLPGQKVKKEKKKDKAKNKKQQSEVEEQFASAEPVTSSLNSEKNKAVMEEIEEMKQHLNDRRARQAQQQREMQELLQSAQPKK